MYLLKKLLSVLEYPAELSKKDVIAIYPLVFQSFWVEKGEVEQLFDAVMVFQNNYQTEETRLFPVFTQKLA